MRSRVSESKAENRQENRKENRVQLGFPLLQSSLTEAAKDIGEVSEEEILRTVRTYRKEKRVPEITVAAES